MDRPQFFLVSGLINIETTLRVSGFPLHYNPVNYPFHGVQTAVSGVGYNVARALHVLGGEVRLLSLVGDDPGAALVWQALARDDLPTEGVLPLLTETPKSVILYEGNGRRQIWVDLKDIQQTGYPGEVFERHLPAADWLALCNINFTRALLGLAQQAGKPIATDVHAVSDPDDGYNRDFMAAAQVLFLSDENLPCPPEDFVRSLQARYGCAIIVVGMGAAGALLAVRRDNFLERLPAASVRPVVSTIGAGDALFSAFLHAYARSGDPYGALRKAMLFAAWKIGALGGAEGFLNAAALDRLAGDV